MREGGRRHNTDGKGGRMREGGGEKKQILSTVCK